MQARTHHRHVHVSSLPRPGRRRSELDGDSERHRIRRLSELVGEVPRMGHEHGIGTVPIGQAEVGGLMVLAVMDPEHHGNPGWP